MQKQLSTGDKAPAFGLHDQNDALIKSASFSGSRLLVYFYPKANTPGCTTQSCAVRDALPQLGKLGVAAVGISPDDPAAQKRFDETNALGFPLLCDQDHAVAEAFGVWGEKKLYGRAYMGIVRSAFLVGADGCIEQSWYKISPKDTVPRLLKALGA